MSAIFRWYDSATVKFGNGSYQSTSTLGSASVSIASQPIKIALLNSSYTFSSSHTVYADLTNEIANGQGYTTGGVALGTVAWTQSSTVTNLTAGSASWTASGTGIPAWRFAVGYCTATLETIVKPLIFCLDNNGSDVAATAAGSNLVITWNAAGVFQLGHS